jgi:Peptidase of plants and bacteria
MLSVRERFENMGGARNRRRLSSCERSYASEIFRTSIDYRAVEITRGSVFALVSATTIGNIVNLRPAHFLANTLELSKIGRLVLIHELVHVWQFQHGGFDYIRSSLTAQVAGWIRTGSRLAAYDWARADKACLPWNRWNAEQQAQCVSDFNLALDRKRSGNASSQDEQALSRALPYIEKVRAREGAPGQCRSE